MAYTAQYTAGDLTSMGIDTAGGVMGKTAQHSGDVASVGIFSSAIMPQLANVVKGSGTMVRSIGGPSATLASNTASERAIQLCNKCLAKRK